MYEYVIKGNNRLLGEVNILGAKNAILPMMAASILADKGKTVISNVPNIKDVDTLSEILRQMGATVKYDSKNRIIEIDCSSINNFTAPYEIVKQMRASFLVIGPLLARFHQAKVSLPGGCAIGDRNVNMHLKALKVMGADIKEKYGFVVAKTDELKGAKIYFDLPSHTGTENIMIAACLAKGTTIIINAACEPEIVDLAHFLWKMGARIYGAGTPNIIIEGKKQMSAVEYEAMPSRIETAFFLATAAITKGELIIKNVILSNLGIVIDKMREMGIEIQEIGDKRVLVKANKRLQSVNFTTWPFPGFPTDFQPQTMALLSAAKGVGIINERVFEDRLRHTTEFNRFGARITKASDQTAVVEGVPCLNGASVMASNLQAGTGLILMALAAEGKSTIQRIYHVDRGYEELEKRLAIIGASITRVKSEEKF